MRWNLARVPTGQAHLAHPASPTYPRLLCSVNCVARSFAFRKPSSERCSRLDIDSTSSAKISKALRLRPKRTNRRKNGTTLLCKSARLLTRYLACARHPLLRNRDNGRSPGRRRCRTPGRRELPRVPPDRHGASRCQNAGRMRHPERYFRSLTLSA